MNWVRRIAAFAMAALSLAMLGCSKGGEQQKETLGLDIDVPITEETLPAAGGEIKMYIPTNADLTDPLSVNTEEMMNFFSLVYESLITINNDGKLNPELAENWTSEDGGKTWTVNLRTGVTWHKVGRNFTANDVTATFERLKTLGEDSYYYYAARYI